MTDERAQRVRSTRRDPTPSEAEKQSGKSEPSQPSQPSEQSETDEPSVKDEHEGLYIYLPSDQKDEAGHVYNAAKATYERENEGTFEKNRHYYPLVVEYGLERVDGADAGELAEMLKDLDY